MESPTSSSPSSASSISSVSSPDIPITLHIGVLALQGAFIEHISHFKQLQSYYVSHHSISIIVSEIRTPEELALVDGLVIPGGESTTIANLASRWNLIDPLKEMVEKQQKPIFGTCAGLILLSNTVKNQKVGGQLLLGGLDITTQRNHYGTQMGSFSTIVHVPIFKDNPDFIINNNKTSNNGNSLESKNSQTGECEALFIRAPGIITIDSAEVKVLATIPNTITNDPNTPVPIAVVQKHLMATTFHPELTKDLRWHKYFADLCLKYKKLGSISS